ncbi:MAG: hypothetical protein HY673_24975 [Chloroflexi bacterium]|nr:hypothetical protein [Chloroflexota bacterium]
MVTLEVFKPSGRTLAAGHYDYAPRLADLNGKTIGELWNGLSGGDRTFPLIRQLLKSQIPGIKFLPYSEFAVGLSEIDNDDIGNIVAAKGCDAVIAGNAA